MLIITLESKPQTPISYFEHARKPVLKHLLDTPADPIDPVEGDIEMGKLTHPDHH
jgi:hypothetical protein